MGHCSDQLTLDVGKSSAQFEGKQRPDIAIYNYKDGKKLLLDVTITHPWAKNNLSGSSQTAGFAALTKEEKNSGEDHCTWSPLPASCHRGVWKMGEICRGYFERSFNASSSYIPSAQFHSRWAIQLSTCLQKENATTIKDKLLSIVGKKRGGLRQISLPSLHAMPPLLV